MKKLLLLATMAAGAAAPAVAQEVVSAASALEPMQIHAPARKAPRADARPYKTFPASQFQNSRILRTAPGIQPAAARLPQGVSFFESFEAPEGSELTWLPEGWTRESHGDATLEDAQKWSVVKGDGWLFPASPDGSCSIGMNFASVQQDEWLISPTVHISDNEELSFQVFMNPFWFFDMSYLDMETYTYSQFVKTGTLEVLAKTADQSEWTKLYDAQDPFIGADGYEMLSEYDLYRPITVSLEPFYGKDAQIAFRLLALDCNTMAMDAVTIGLPHLDEVWYQNPIETLYFGYDDDPTWRALNAGIAVYPVNGPITWTNGSPYTDATYTWGFNEPVTAAWTTADGTEDLTLTYGPDFSGESAKLNNLFYPHLLTASKPGAQDGTYSPSFDYLQAGGGAERKLSDGSVFLAGMLPHDPKTDGMTYLTTSDYGGMASPIVGYDVNTDKYWYAQTFPGEDNPAYDSYVDGFINALWPASQPLVVERAHVLAVGKVKEQAELTLSIIPLNDEGVPQTDNPVVTCVAKADDFKHYNNGTMSYDLLTIPFVFEKPVVLDNSVYGYMIMVSGYHNDNFEYFAPIQSNAPSKDFTFGYVMKYTKYDSDTYRESYYPMPYIEGVGGPFYNTFCINLVGYYGYLETEISEVKLMGEPVEIPFKSFVSADKLHIEAPAGLKVEAAGRFDNVVLTVDNDGSDTPANGNLVVSDHARTVTIPVTDVAGVSGAAVAAPAELTGIYTLAGVRMAESAQLPAGVYIRKYSDGTATKLIVR